LRAKLNGMKSNPFIILSAAFLTSFSVNAQTLHLPPTPQFRATDIPSHIYSGEWEFFVGGGIAVFDCNDDQRPEIYGAGGEGQASLMVNQSSADKIAFAKNTPENLALTSVTGAYPLDIDSDGILDLAILRLGQNKLMKGLGNCQFGAFDTAMSLPLAQTWTTAFSATWEGDAQLPTLAFGNYIDRSDPDGPFESCDTSYLMRPIGDRYGPPFALDPGFCTLSMLFSDWGRNGRADLRVSNDRHYYVRNGAEQLWAMGTTPTLYTAEDGWVDYSLWGMGIASRDITGDGLPEVYLTSMGDQKLHSLSDKSRPTYENAPFDKGITAHRPYTGGDGRASTGWHVAFGDVQNDGYDDIFVTKGNVEQMPVAAMLDPNNLLIATGNGDFVERGDVAGVASLARGRGGALVDLNGDGLLDIVVNNRREPMEAFQNTTKVDGNWVGIDLRQASPNTFAVGAIVEVRRGEQIWTQELTVGGGHAGGTLVPLHFGLGKVQGDVHVTVTWPDQSKSLHENMPLNQIISITR